MLKFALLSHCDCLNSKPLCWCREATNCMRYCRGSVPLSSTQTHYSSHLFGVFCACLLYISISHISCVQWKQTVSKREKQKRFSVYASKRNTNTLPMLLCGNARKTGGIPERGILSPLSKEPSPWFSLMYGLPQL